jgi:hypothetical protein
VQFPGTDGYANGDINYDGVIDGADYGVIDNSVQLQGAPFPAGTYPGAAAGASSAATITGITVVPEPGALGVPAMAAMAAVAATMMRRGHRRRRRPA